jgi:hypothetical protein
VQTDEDINDGAGALMIISVISALIGFVLIPSMFAAHKDNLGHTCIMAMYGLAGAMIILAGVLSVAAVLVVGGSDMREAFCWRYEVQAVGDSGLDDAHCNYGASFWSALIGAFFCALSALLLFSLVRPADIEWVYRQPQSGNLDAAPAGAAKVSEMEKAAVREANKPDQVSGTDTVHSTDNVRKTESVHESATTTENTDSKENPPGTSETSETERMAVQEKTARENQELSETEKLARVQAAQEVGATAPSVSAPKGSATAAKQAQAQEKQA